MGAGGASAARSYLKCKEARGAVAQRAAEGDDSYRLSCVRLTLRRIQGHILRIDLKVEPPADDLGYLDVLDLHLRCTLTDSL